MSRNFNNNSAFSQMHPPQVLPPLRQTMDGRDPNANYHSYTSTKINDIRRPLISMKSNNHVPQTHVTESYGLFDQTLDGNRPPTRSPIIPLGGGLVLKRHGNDSFSNLVRKSVIIILEIKQHSTNKKRSRSCHFQRP
jgi:hypothetical protein